MEENLFDKIRKYLNVHVNGNYVLSVEEASDLTGKKPMSIYQGRFRAEKGLLKSDINDADKVACFMKIKELFSKSFDGVYSMNGKGSFIKNSVMSVMEDDKRYSIIIEEINE